MRILYLCHRIPFPPDKGDKIRSYHEIAYLARRHEVDVFTLIDDPADLRHVDALRGLVRHLHVERLHPLPARLVSLLAIFTGRSLSERYFQRRPLRQAVSRAVATRAYELAIVYSSAMAPYLRGFTGPVALDYVDVDSAKWQAYGEQAGRSPLGWLYRREGQRLRALEAEFAERAALTLVCSPREAQELRSFCAPRNLHTVGNGTDTDYFAPAAAPAPAAPYLVFTGAMDYRANVDAVVWFVDEVYPRVRAQCPEAGLRIVGSNPAPAVRRLAERPGVVVTGRVADIRPHLRGAALAVAPLRVARGIQNKVLEALACGIPVVATSAAAQGIEGEPPLCVADEPAAFAAAVVRLLGDPLRRGELASAGRTFIVERYGWERQLERLSALLSAAASSHPAQEVEEPLGRGRAGSGHAVAGP